MKGLLIEISTNSSIPIYKQLRDQIILGIAKGELQPEEQLPSVRQLSDEIGVNTMTISKAYNLMKEEGYLITDRRLGTKVAPFANKKSQLPEVLHEQLELLLAEANIQQVSNLNIMKEIQDILSQFRKDDWS